MKIEFLTKAKENLIAAQMLLEHQLCNASVNRAYYSAFQAAVAALADKNLTSKKSEHSWVQSTFSNELINKRKVYPGRIKSYLMEMQRIRNTADYTEIPISKTVARRPLIKAKEFLDFIEKELNP